LALSQRKMTVEIGDEKTTGALIEIFEQFL